MPSRVYDLLSELSTPNILRTQTETKILMDELRGLLESGEDAGKFRSSVLDTYYSEFIKEAIRTCRKKCKEITDSLYYPVLEILFRKYRVDPDNTDEKYVTPLKFATDRKCKPFMKYLQSKGSKQVQKKTPQKKKKTPPKKNKTPPKKKKTPPKKKKSTTKSAAKKCDLRLKTGRCVNGSKNSRKCYRNATTKRCRKKR